MTIEPDRQSKWKFWGVRYRAYRTKNPPVKAFLKGIVLGELAFRWPFRSWAERMLRAEEMSLMQQLVQVELVSVEFHLGEESNEDPHR